ncbi:hypothetical protein KVP09_13525 [Alcaligenaceae bacterium CGII-47]|nr:hypothetical protein [Alcaligenaceae bacterium CGII-47]
MKNVCVSTLFAEDVRHEQSGQVSLIGVFDDIAEVSKLPTDTLKISLFTTVSTLVDDPFCPTSFRVFLSNGVTVISQDLPDKLADVQVAAITHQKESNPEQSWISMRVIILLNSLKITEETSLEVEFEDSAGRKTKSNALAIKQKNKPPSTNISATG